MIVVAGEALIDLAPRDQVLVPLPGGSPFNVAVGLGRLDREVAFLGRLSRDGFGRRLAELLQQSGVRIDLAASTDDPTTLAVVHLGDRGDASYGFYLDGTSAPGLTTRDLSDLPAGVARHVSFGAVTLDTAPGGHALTELLVADRGHAVASLDPNVRPSMIQDLDAYRERLDTLVAAVDLVKVSEEDLASLAPGVHPLAVAQSWAASGPAWVILTRGAAGAVARSRNGVTVEVPGEPVQVVDTVGAGDAFTAGLLAWLDQHGALERDDLEQLREPELDAALRHANHAAAVTCTRVGADPPRLAELQPS